MKKKIFFPLSGKAIFEMILMLLLIIIFGYVSVDFFVKIKIIYGIIGTLMTLVFTYVPYNLIRMRIVFAEDYIKLPWVMKEGWIKQKKTFLFYSNIKNVSFLQKNQQGEHSLKDLGSLVNTIRIGSVSQVFLIRADIFSELQIKLILEEIAKRRSESSLTKEDDNG